MKYFRKICFMALCGYTPLTAFGASGGSYSILLLVLSSMLCCAYLVAAECKAAINEKREES